MARLIYSAIMSLDGYTADADGRFEWAAPAEEVFAFVNELERPVGAYLYGRRMYDGLVDEYQLFLVPAVIGAGTRALPGQVRLNLTLAQERRFGSGVIYLCYHPA